MTYSYDRTASSLSSILRLIVRGIMNERPVASLVAAYVEERLEDMDPPSFDSVSEEETWMRKHIHLVSGRDAVERAMQRAYVAIYRAKVPWATPQSAIETFDMPQSFPVQAPQEVIDAVADTLARRDAAEAHALRDLAMRRQA